MWEETLIKNSLLKKHKCILLINVFIGRSSCLSISIESSILTFTYFYTYFIIISLSLSLSVCFVYICIFLLWECLYILADVVRREKIRIAFRYLFCFLSSDANDLVLCHCYQPSMLQTENVAKRYWPVFSVRF